MTLIAHFRTITPAFCAGADQNGPSEIREFAIKGMLRWFYRALDGACTRDREAAVFGSAAGNGTASPVVLRVVGRLIGNKSYQNELQPQRALTDGACYLGYTLYLGQNRRLGIEPDREFRLALAPRWADPSADVSRAWLASLWLLGHLGGLGSRMRRGFGTIALTRLEGDWPDIARLPLPHNAPSVQVWRQQFDAGYRIIRQWFPTARQASSVQPSIPESPRILIGPEAPDWISALRHVGTLMRNFRAHPPKYPRNAAFGLPLTSTSQHDTIIPDRRELDRSPSRLWIRVIHVGGKYYPLVWLQESALLPAGGIRWRRGQGRPPNLEAPPGLGVLPAFLSHLQGQGYC